jgi:HAD superfamily hydrolase (TIGR01459 family)
MVPTSNWIDPAARRATRFASGIGEFAEEYDLWLVDQWGVLHGGGKPFPGVVACLQELMDQGKRVVLLSNSGKQAAVNVSRLAAMGIAPELYTAIVTSGELARLRLSQHYQPFDVELGHRCLLLSSDGDRSITDGLDIEPVAAIGDADFILLSGVDDSLPREYYQAIFELGGARGLPLICANPDLVRFTEQGMMPSAGEFARLYEDLGGRVSYIGKPYPEIYHFCLDQFGPGIPSRTIAVGDSLYHDVRGGIRAGLATAFVMDGIHRQEFEDLDTGAKRQDRLRELARDFGGAPDWAIPRFVW